MVKQITFKNKIFSKKELKEVVYTAFTQYGITRTCLLADEIKNLGCLLRINHLENLNGNFRVLN
jgi:DNA-directed RNA polymerase beta' subunit